MTRILEVQPRAGVDPQKVEVSDNVQGMLLWDAARDAKEALAKAHNVCHNILDDNDEGYQQQSMARFGAELAGVGRDLEDAGKRIALFSEGVQGDTFTSLDGALSRTDLGPRIEANLRVVYVQNDASAGSSDQPTFVREVNTRVNVYMGINRFERERSGPSPFRVEPRKIEQPFVAITMDDAPFQFIAESGEPILNVNIHEADIYDNEGDGDKSVPTQEMIEKIIRAGGFDLEDFNMEENVLRIQKALER